jgi:hypothetical protein
MTRVRLFLVLASAVLPCAWAAAAEADGLKSGPQAGRTLPGPFLSLVAHSGDPGLVGKRNDFVEMHGQNPVVMVFAREMTKPLTRLLNKLDAAAAEHKSARMRVVVVMLSDDDSLEDNLKKCGEEQGIKHVNLAIMEPDGPKNYDLSRESEVTVLLYKRLKVEANHAFKKGELTEEGLKSILADVPKITAKR